MRNGTQTNKLIPFSKHEEMLVYDELPPDIREVLREAPFDVSVCDMLTNSAVVQALERNGPEWLREQLVVVYRRKFVKKDA
jgi:hypothetical protein